MSKFLGLFRKKNGNKENEHPTELDREMSYRKSQRSASASKPKRTTRFDFPEGEEYLDAAAPYRVPGVPRLNKGPQSCPGGIREDHRTSMNRSFDTTESQSERRYKRDSRYDRGDKYRKSMRDTSEYGSGDPSPIGHVGRHYQVELDEDSDDVDYEDFPKTKEMEQMEQMEHALERTREKLKYSEQRHMHYKNKVRQMMQTKEQMENAFISRVNQLTMEKDNMHARLQEEIKSLRKQIHSMQMNSYGMGMGAHPNFNQQAQFGSGGTPFSGPQGFGAPFPLSVAQQRMPPMMQGMNPRPSNTNTPVTRGESMGGAGEALTEQSDVSYVQSSHMNSSFGSKVDNKDVSIFQNLNLDDLETPRAEVRTTSPALEAEKNDLNNTLLTDKKTADSRSTVRADESPTKNSESVKLRRSSSDPIYPLEMRRTDF